jgi:hypothetical protein
MLYKQERYKKKMRRFVVMTETEFIEVSEKFAFYWEKYEQDLVYFYKAFIHKNKLFSKPSGETLDREPTREEIEEYQRVQEMMQGLKKYNLQRQLENN